MITIKDKESLEKMRHAGSILAAMLHDIALLIRPGVNTLSLDEWIARELDKNSLVSATRGYHGYQHYSCISVNDEVVHGVPTANKILKEGDFVKIDVCASWKGYHADMARMFFVGEPNPELKRMAEVAQIALDKGINKAVPGNRLSDISAAIQYEVESNGYGVVRDFAGHGIGKSMHEDPELLNYGRPGKGPLLQVGMVFAIEPMITMGSYRVFVARDGWTVKTIDGGFAAHVEDTVLVGEHGPEVLTRVEHYKR